MTTATRRSIVAIALFMAVPPGASGAQEPATRGHDWWADHVAFISRDGGVWETPNPAAASDPTAPDAFGLAWRAVDNGQGLVGRLYGVEAGRETVEFWTFRAFRHPGKGVVVLEQWGPGGMYGVGEITSPEAGRTVVEQTFWLPDGRSWREGHRAEDSGDRHETEVFDIGADGVWTAKAENVWRRAAAHAASG